MLFIQKQKPTRETALHHVSSTHSTHSPLFIQFFSSSVGSPRYSNKLVHIELSAMNFLRTIFSSFSADVTNSTFEVLLTFQNRREINIQPQKRVEMLGIYVGRYVRSVQWTITRDAISIVMLIINVTFSG